MSHWPPFPDNFAELNALERAQLIHQATWRLYRRMVERRTAQGSELDRLAALRQQQERLAADLHALKARRLPPPDAGGR